MQIVAGVDGGGTRTRVAISTEEGEVLGSGVSGPSNYESTSPEKVKANIKEAFESAGGRTERNSSQIQALYMGMAGARSKKDCDTIKKLVKEIDLIDPESIYVHHDLRISLAGGLGGKEGIVLIAGTGSSCYGRREDGREWLAGGWGHVLDDKGSAYDLARQALIAVVRDEDGRGPQTRLTDYMKEGLSIINIDEIPRRLHFEGFRGEGVPMSKKELASLAPLVTRAANENDEVARHIVEEGIRELVLMVQTVAETLDFKNKNIPVVITGGLVRQSKYIKSRLCKNLHEVLPDCKIHEPRFPPIVGSVMLALDKIGIEINDPLLGKLEETLPAGLD